MISKLNFIARIAKIPALLGKTDNILKGVYGIWKNSEATVSKLDKMEKILLRQEVYLTDYMKNQDATIRMYSEMVNHYLQPPLSTIIEGIASELLAGKDVDYSTNDGMPPKVQEPEDFPAPTIHSTSRPTPPEELTMVAGMEEFVGDPTDSDVPRPEEY